MDIHILLKSIPKVVFSHMYATHVYQMPLEKKINLIEITYFEKCSISYQEEDEPVIEIPPNSIFIKEYKKPSFGFSNGPHKHYTMGISVEYELTTPDDPNAIHLQTLMSDPNFVADACKIIKKCSHSFLLDQTNQLKNTAYVFDLFALYQNAYDVNNLLLRSPSISHSAVHYVKQAKDYVLHHISEKITVDSVAENLSISKGYLSNIFKQVCGISLVRYVNEKRLEMLKNLIIKESATLSEACFLVGFDNPNYVSRLFKKYYGQPLRELKKN